MTNPTKRESHGCDAAGDEFVVYTDNGGEMIFIGESKNNDPWLLFRAKEAVEFAEAIMSVAEPTGWKQRVIAEKDQLDKRIARLKEFATTKTFDDMKSKSRRALLKQWGAMQDYSIALGDRIKMFQDE